MRIKRITHKDGTTSYTSSNVTIVKNKEAQEEQKIVEIEAESAVIASEQES